MLWSDQKHSSFPFYSSWCYWISNSVEEFWKNLFQESQESKREEKRREECSEVKNQRKPEQLLHMHSNFIKPNSHHLVWSEWNLKRIRFTLMRYLFQVPSNACLHHHHYRLYHKSLPELSLGSCNWSIYDIFSFWTKIIWCTMFMPF